MFKFLSLYSVGKCQYYTVLKTLVVIIKTPLSSIKSPLPQTTYDAITVFIPMRLLSQNEHVIVMGWIINLNFAATITLHEEAVQRCIFCLTRLVKAELLVGYGAQMCTP